MILSGRGIVRALNTGSISISPFYLDRLGCNSYDLTLADELLTYENDGVLDPKQDNKTLKLGIPESGLTIYPNTLYLGRTDEYTETDNYVPMIEGVSSVARLGISIHSTAGFGDVGFKGYWTLEISCIQPVKLFPRMRIAQIYYVDVRGECGKYKGKYQSNTGVEASKMWREWI